MDITMQKKAEEALLKARIEWERTFDALPDLIAIIDQKHRILRVNKSMAERLRLKPEQCFGLQCFVCVHETDEAPSFCPHVKTLKDGRKHIVQIHDDRLGGDFVVSTSPLTDENGKIFATIHIAREIDDETV
jgi:PAS domain S-box-containing protein